MPLEIKTQKRPEAVVLSCAGRLVFGDETAELRSRVKELLAEDPRIILELSAVKDVDSGGVGTLVGLFTSATAAGGDLKLVSLSKKVMQTLTVTRLTGVLHIYDRIEDAIAAFATQPARTTK